MTFVNIVGISLFGLMLLILVSVLLVDLYYSARLSHINHQTWLMHDAICRYDIWCFNKNKIQKVFVHDMMQYNGPKFRFWKWSCKDLLPEEKYEIVKPFIRKEDENDQDLVRR